MGALDSLRTQLNQTTDQAFRGLVFDQKPMAQELKHLHEWVVSAGSTKPARNQMLDALRRFHRTKTLSSLRETRLVCHACLETLEEDCYCLIDDTERFTRLLKAAHQYRENPRQLRRCYRALLHVYFVYDVDAGNCSDDGKRNWAELRTHLRGWADQLAGEGVLPDWVDVITKHRNLLSDDPCVRYGLSMLEGRREEFEQALSELAIPGTSWLVRRLVLAQVHAAVQLNDAGFRLHIPALLALLNEHEHEPLQRAGLAKILERYKACGMAGVRPDLRDFAVKHWGNPWLKRHSAPWSWVSEQTKAMVTDWVKLDLIHQFFSLLAEDGASDTRRLRFWQRYRAHIDDVHFALGSTARTNRSPDFLAVREKMDGRVRHLFAAGPSENNAFIMCIGEHVVVEFGSRNNACFIFDRDTLPFDLARQDIAGNRDELKHDSRLERLRHADQSGQTWEDHFEGVLATLLRVRPSDPDTLGAAYTAGPRSSNQPAATGARQSAPLSASEPKRTGPAPWNYPAGTPGEPFSRREFERFCGLRRLRVVDHTDQGGNLRVVTDNRDEAVNRQFKAWDFQYKEGRGWWRKEG